MQWRQKWCQTQATTTQGQNTVSLPHIHAFLKFCLVESFFLHWWWQRVAFPQAFGILSNPGSPPETIKVSSIVRKVQKKKHNLLKADQTAKGRGNRNKHIVFWSGYLNHLMFVEKSVHTKRKASANFWSELNPWKALLCIWYRKMVVRGVMRHFSSLDLKERFSGVFEMCFKSNWLWVLRWLK